MNQPDEPNDLSWLWWLLLILLLIAAIVTRIWWTLPETCEKRAKDENGRSTVYLQAVHDALRIAGLVRTDTETPQMFFRRAEQTGWTEASAVGIIEELRFYAHADSSPEQTDALRQAYTGMLRKMNAWQRVRFVLLRAAVPLRMRLFTGK